MCRRQIKGLVYGLVVGLVLSLILAGTGAADTNVSGIISSDTVWTLTGSPYIVTGNILVNSGVTLTINPGVIIKFNSGTALQIAGTLIARGTGNSKITFTSSILPPAPGDWGYILFSDSSSDATYGESGNYTGGSILEYCIVEYAGGVSVSDNGAVRMDNGHPFINYCTIRNNKASGIYAWNLSGNLKITNSTINNNTASRGGGIYIYGGNATISNNTISNNTASYDGGGIYTTSQNVNYGRVNISNNAISNNSASSSGGGIYAKAGYYGTVTISNNAISNNSASSSGGGIYADDTGSNYFNRVVISNNTISNNSTSGNGGGIYTEAIDCTNTVTIFSNIISNNAAASYGGGIYSYAFDAGGAGDSPVTISSNIISNNTASYGGGIYTTPRAGYYTTVTISNNSIIRNSAQNNAGVYYYSAKDNKDFKYNTITGNKTTVLPPTYTVYVSRSHPLFNYNNIFNNTATYELWNDNAQGSANVNAENNWWGTAIESEIQAKIYDWLDDSSKGIVDYNPWSTTIRTDAPISPPTGFTAAMGADLITLNWAANPEADVAGYKVYYGRKSGYPYANVVDVGNVTNYTINGITSGTYYVTVTAYDTSYNPANDDPNTIVNENQTNGNESWFSQEQMVTDLVLYDDFSGNYINRNKWRWCEFVREIDSDNQRLISKLGSPNPNVVGTYPYSHWNWLSFPGPNSVNSIQTDVMILENAATNSAQTRARLGGRWYNDGTSGEGMIGDIWAEVSLTGGPTGLYADIAIVKFTNSNGTTWILIKHEEFTTPIILGTVYTLYIGYDSLTNQFTFRIGSEEITVGAADLPVRTGNAKSPFKGLGTTVQIDNANSSAFVAAAFDNVYKNGSLYDDFSGSTIDSIKWTTYEFVREISEGDLWSKVRSSLATASPVNNYLDLANPSSINIIQVKVKPVQYQNDQGTVASARIAGYFFNDGTPGGGRIGEVGAQVRIGGTGAEPKGEWVVWREKEQTALNPDILGYGTFNKPIYLDTTYTLLLGWDGSQFTFKIDDEVAHYAAVTSINPPNILWKGIGTQIWNPSSKEATIEALFDDVMVNRFRNIAIEPDSLNFGNVQVGNSADHTITVSNSGTESLEITSVVGPYPPFSIVGGTCSNPPFTLIPWGSCEVVLRFSPSTASLFSDSITINSNDPDEPAVTISLEGTGTSGLPCDCNSDGQTTIDEVQKSINCFLGISSQPCCCDLNGNGQCTIDEVQRCINAFLGITS